MGNDLDGLTLARAIHVLAIVHSGGSFRRNNQVLGASQENLVSASQLSQTTYQSGSGTDTLWVRVSDRKPSGVT
jgi:hypothetical protein